ncbi:hypothetical protein [Burkholderia cepacia]|uniref:hypothetical protein n=1 Tax=Burkholderia cepacia TaxID=292 RepID=UPI00158C48E9|nr:hypothetical protein [Burkholderia cepacia]
MKKPLLAQRDARAARHGGANLANAGPAVASSMHGLRGRRVVDARPARAQRSR